MFRNLAEDATIEIYFETFASTGAPVAPSSAFTTSDFAIYKNGSATVKATTNGMTVTSPFNSETGCHLLVIDTSNDTGDSGFWTTGARYQVKFNTAKTVDSKSIDGRSVPRGSFGIQSEYMRGTENALQPTVTGRTVDVSAAGNVGIDWANIENPTAANSFSGSYIALQNNQSVILNDGAITASKFAANAITAASIASDAGTEIGAAVLSALGTGTWATAITGKTDNLPSDPADASDITAAFGTVNSTLTTIAGYLDTEIAAIKTKTDQFVFTTANKVDATAVLDSAAILAVADQVWDEATSGHTTAGTYGGRIVRATNSNTEVQITGSNHIAADVHDFQTGVITAGDFAANSITASALATDAVTEIQSGLATAASITTLRGADNDTLKTLSDQIDGLSASTGSGARTVTITVNDGTTALQNARVRLTEGANTYTGLTNASGVVTFNLDDATYTVGITKSGYSYAGTTLVVDGTETRTYSMTVVTVTPPDDPALCAVTFHMYDQYGADMASQPVDITFVKWETTATDTPPVLSVPPVQTTNSDGVVSVNLFREATYKIVYGNAPYTRRVDVTIPDAGTYTVEI